MHTNILDPTAGVQTRGLFSWGSETGAFGGGFFFLGEQFWGENRFAVDSSVSVGWRSLLKYTLLFYILLPTPSI